MKALGGGEGAGDVQWDWAGPGPGVGVWQALWGVLGLGRWGPDSPEGFGCGRHSLWAGSALNTSGFPSAHPEALKAGTCTAAAGSGPASFEPLPALVPSEASLPVLQ